MCLKLQVLELTDALAVNSTAVRLEWHLLLSDTEYYIEVIHWNNLIALAIRRLLKHSFSLTMRFHNKIFFFFTMLLYRDFTFDTATWAAMPKSTTAWRSWSQTARCTTLEAWINSRNMNFSFRHFIGLLRVNRAILKLFKHSRMVSSELLSFQFNSEFFCFLLVEFLN